jgi:3-oxoacyl-[acyl-carrier protein] reductase
MRIKDKVAIVTGAGRGIGEAIALRFAEEGAKLIINDVNEADANRTVETIKGKGPRKWWIQPLENSERWISW